MTWSRADADPAGESSLAEKRFQAIYDSINDGILLLDPGTGAILEVNRQVRDWFGWGPGELPDLDLGRLGLGLWPYTRDCALERCGKAAAGEPQSFEWLCTAAGGLLWLEMTLCPALIGGQARLVATAGDITQRKRAEMESAARLKRAEAQNAVSLALAGVGTDYEAALRLIAHHLAVQVGDLCTLSLLGEDGLLYPAEAAQPYLDGADLMPRYRQLPPLAPGQFGAGQVIQTGRALRLENRPTEELRPLFRPELAPYLERFQLHSLMVVPMRTEGRTIGTLALATGGASRRPYSVEDQAVIQNLADRAALTITNARLYAENLAQAAALKKTNQELERRVAERTAELAEANARLQQLALEDGLTRLANRRHFDQVLDTEIRRALRKGDWLSLVLGDLDFFKRYNDQYGHVAGDGCLQAVGEVMKDVFRRVEELPARYGGEEFAVVLPGADPETARQAAEKFRAAVEARRIPHSASEAGPFVTVSLGYVSARVSASTTPDWFITLADEGLYRSKAEGRNRVTAAD
jgi:diguanylate cyclase (GGDEF)-like protein/PAS domain S-box-containing protein